MAEHGDGISVVTDADGVALLAVDNSPLNALSAVLLAALAKRAHALTDDPAVKAVVITGNDRAFAAGADVTQFSPDRESARVVSASFRTACDAIASIPRPVIAAIRGYALGGGLEVALACDLRVASDTARLGQPEILLGIIPGGGGTQRLARLVGPSRAKDIILTGRQVTAEEALRIGLADRVVPADQLLPSALELAGELAAGALVAQRLAKLAIDDGLDGTLADGLSLEQDLFVQVFGTEDATTGVQSFLAKEKPTFTGR